MQRKQHLVRSAVFFVVLGAITRPHAHVPYPPKLSYIMLSGSTPRESSMPTTAFDIGPEAQPRCDVGTLSLGARDNAPPKERSGHEVWAHYRIPYNRTCSTLLKDIEDYRCGTPNGKSGGRLDSLGGDPIRKHHNVRQRRRHEAQGFSPISGGIGENSDLEKRKAHAGKKKRHKHRKTGTVLCRECP